jgi:phosphoglycolate phosphatase
VTPALVMFDLDGTLVETAPEITDAVNDTLAEAGWPVVTQGQVESWIGQGTGELLIAALSQATGKTAAAVRKDRSLAPLATRFDQHYARRCGSRSRPYPGACELLRALRQRGVKLAVLTNKETRFVHPVLAAHGLTACFDSVVCGDTLATKKPDPAGMHGCLAAFGTRPEQALMVGDSSIDAATARNAGVSCWLLPHGYNSGQPVEACGPDRVVADFAALADALAVTCAATEPAPSGVVA